MCNSCKHIMIAFIHFRTCLASWKSSTAARILNSKIRTAKPDV